VASRQTVVFVDGTVHVTSQRTEEENARLVKLVGESRRLMDDIHIANGRLLSLQQKLNEVRYDIDELAQK